MSLQCPYCASRNVSYPHTGTKVVTCFSAICGAAGAIYTTVAKQSPLNLTVATISNLIVTGLAGAVSGSALGSKIGQEFDRTFFPNHQCHDCMRSFSPLVALE